MNIRLLLVAGVCSGFLAGCYDGKPDLKIGDAGDPVGTDEPYIYQVPVVRDDGWETDSLANVGIDQEIVVEMTDHVRDRAFGYIDSILVVRDGKLVYEEYFGDNDWTRLHDMYSVSKSVVSMLVGSAIDEGYIPDVQQKILPLFPQYAPYGTWDERKNDVDIENLLTMTTGLDCDDTNGASPGREILLLHSEDWIEYFLGLPVVNDPGTKSLYCAGSVATLAAVVSVYTGQPSWTYARDALFDPLQIDTYNWQVGPDGVLHPNGLSLRSRDMAKLGQVMLTGTWNGQTILSQDWIDASSAHQVTDPTGDSAGYLWWRVTVQIDGAPEDIFFALGNGGQSIAVVPSHNTVFAFTGSNFRGNGLYYLTALVNNHLLPAL